MNMNIFILKRKKEKKSASFSKKKKKRKKRILLSHFSYPMYQSDFLKSFGRVLGTMILFNESSNILDGIEIKALSNQNYKKSVFKTTQKRVFYYYYYFV